MTQTNLNAYAMANGWGTTIDQMTQAQQVMLRFSYVTDVLNKASGDFAKTSGRHKLPRPIEILGLIIGQYR